MTPRDRLISTHLPLAKIAVDVFLARRPEYRYLQDDIESECTARMVAIVDQHLAGQVGHLSGYIRRVIHTAIWDTIRLDATIQTPRRSYAKRERFVDWSEFAENEQSTSDRAPLEGACRDELDTLIVAMRIAGKSVKSIIRELMLTEIELEDRIDGIIRRVKHEKSS